MDLPDPRIIICQDLLAVLDRPPFFKDGFDRLLRFVNVIEEDMDGIYSLYSGNAPYTAYPDPSPLPRSSIVESAFRIAFPSIR